MIVSTTPQEKKKINPNKTCYKMYAINNKDANKVEEILGRRLWKDLRKCANHGLLIL